MHQSRRNIRMRSMVLLSCLSFSCSVDLYSQTRPTEKFEKETIQLERSVRKISGVQRSFEARVAALEQINLNPKPGEFHRHYVQANRDGITIELSQITANAYQYKIRPGTMGGGSGRYIGFAIPQKMVITRNAVFEAQVFPESVVIIGKSKLNLGSVQATINDTGSTGHWIFTGEFE